MTNELKHVEALRKGSNKSFAFLYEKYIGMLYSFVYEIAGDKMIAEDIVQEAFIKVWMYRENIDIAQSFRNYLFTIARNLLLNELRKKVNVTLPIEVVCDEVLGVKEVVEDNEFNEKRLLKIKIAKQKLPAR